MSQGLKNSGVTPQLPKLLLAGNFLSSLRGYRSVMEDLAEKLRDSASTLICASPYRAGWARGLHMCSTALFRRWNYDFALVDLFSGRAFIWGATLSFLLAGLRCPFILVLRGGALPDFARRYPKRVKACLSLASAVIAPSRYLLEQMRPYRSDIRMLPNPLDVKTCTFTLRERPQSRLVWVRSFHEIYNPSLALKVGALLAVDYPETRLTMVGPDRGDGSLQHVQQLVEDLHLVNRVTLAGAVPQADVPYWMTKGDIFLNTTNVDNTPVSVLQAMACGVCVVSTNAGGIPYLLEHERDALLVSPDDPLAMATAVRRLLADPGLAKQLARNARQKAEQFDWTIILPQWQKQVISVAKRSRK